MVHSLWSSFQIILKMTFIFINFIFLYESVQIVAIIRSSVKTFPRVFEPIIYPDFRLYLSLTDMSNNDIGKIVVNPGYKRVQLVSSRVGMYEIVPIDRSSLFEHHWKTCQNHHNRWNNHFVNLSDFYGVLLHFSGLTN